MGGAGVRGIEGTTTSEEVASGAGASTLGDVAGARVGWLGLVVPRRMSISCCSDWDWLSLNGARGELGKGKWRAWRMSARPALV